MTRRLHWRRLQYTCCSPVLPAEGAGLGTFVLFPGKKTMEPRASPTEYPEYGIVELWKHVLPMILSMFVVLLMSSRSGEAHASRIELWLLLVAAIAGCNWPRTKARIFSSLPWKPQRLTPHPGEMLPALALFASPPSHPMGGHGCFITRNRGVLLVKSLMSQDCVCCLRRVDEPLSSIRTDYGGTPYGGPRYSPWSLGRVPSACPTLKPKPCYTCAGNLGAERRDMSRSDSSAGYNTQYTSLVTRGCFPSWAKLAACRAETALFSLMQRSGSSKIPAGVSASKDHVLASIGPKESGGIGAYGMSMRVEGIKRRQRREFNAATIDDGKGQRCSKSYVPFSEDPYPT
ncbi:hypothetical protein N658DRAFT_365213 [Parathielavia hyrcaniae]|uniref:Uncharacterized protein n=1 Tax=Parathielavia hyrcaniae TaxID=113614 RepID=A0AAN6PVF0_9PEZI|nr:hypothetical protein N658DRAFT_365213 [Parathielavia hyrcaniae]